MGCCQSMSLDPDLVPVKDIDDLIEVLYKKKSEISIELAVLKKDHEKLKKDYSENLLKNKQFLLVQIEIILSKCISILESNNYVLIIFI